MSEDVQALQTTPVEPSQFDDAMPVRAPRYHAPARKRKKEAEAAALALLAPLPAAATTEVDGAGPDTAEMSPPSTEANVEAEPEPAAPITARIEVYGLGPARAWPPLEAELVLHAGDCGPVPPQLASSSEPLPPDLAALDARLRSAAQASVAIVVAGDPLLDGPGRRLLAALGPDRVRIHAGSSPLQAALARIGFAVDEVQVLDLERIGDEGLLARLRRGRLYAIRPGGRPLQAIGRLLERAGFHQARIWLAGPDAATPVSALLAFELSDLPPAERGELFVLAYLVGADGSSRDWPGIPRREFDGALPEAARLLALSWLQPGAEECGWSIEGEQPALALDWSRERPEAEIHCIGIDAEALEALALHHQAGQGLAAEQAGNFHALEALPEPNVAFLRAGAEFTQQVRTAWERLKPGGRMVVAAEGEQARLELMQFAHRNRPQHWQDLQVSEGLPAGARFEIGAARGVRLMGWHKPPRG